jgi:tripartite ATP-independent transporter DctM subunit
LQLLLSQILPLGSVVFAVVGLIALGIATPSESAAFGVLAVACVAAWQGCLTVSVLQKSLEDTVRVTGMVFVLVIAASVFSQIIAFSGLSRAAVEWGLQLGGDPTLTLTLMFAAVLVLGCFLDQISIMLLTIPIFFPLVQALGLDAVWFGLMMLLALEMSLTTPPFGLLLFVMMGVAPAGTRFGDVVRAALPYLGCNFLLGLLLLAFPAIALWLPDVLLR